MDLVSCLQYLVCARFHPLCISGRLVSEKGCRRFDAFVWECVATSVGIFSFEFLCNFFGLRLQLFRQFHLNFQACHLWIWL